MPEECLAPSGFVSCVAALMEPPEVVASNHRNHLLLLTGSEVQNSQQLV